MNITTYQDQATLQVAVDGDNKLGPDDAGVASQLQAAFALALKQWRDKLGGAVMVSDVTVTLDAEVSPEATQVVAPASKVAP